MIEDNSKLESITPFQIQNYTTNKISVIPDGIDEIRATQENSSISGQGLRDENRGYLNRTSLYH